MISNEVSSKLKKELQTINLQTKTVFNPNSKLKDYTENLELLIKKQHKQLKEAERLAAIGQTAGMVGHDIRNPLQAIISELFLARNECLEASGSQIKEAMLESIEFIEEQVEYINKIVRDLQDYARPISPEFRLINVEDTIEGAIATLSVPDNLQLNIQFDKQLIQIRLDPMLLKRVLINLITNSIQAMPKGGRLTIITRKKSDTAVITVADTGIGIPNEIKPKLFKPLMTSKAKGQGFGLAVAKRLVEAQGGQISFESEKGKGTTFTLEFPISSFGRKTTLLDFAE